MIAHQTAVKAQKVVNSKKPTYPTEIKPTLNLEWRNNTQIRRNSVETKVFMSADATLTK